MGDARLLRGDRRRREDAPASGEGLRVPTIDFSGFSWEVKESGSEVGPGPNRFSAENVTTDEHGLHLRIAQRGPRWTCAEVVAQGEFGYGTYTWALASDVTRLDRNAVLGMFTWSDLPDHSNREMDIEFARWGGTHPRGSGVFTVQAASVGESFDFSITHGRGSRHTMSWGLGRVTFSSSTGAAPTTWSYRGSDVPRPGGDVAPRINLWLFRGIAPAGAQGMTVASFTYTAAEEME